MKFIQGHNRTQINLFPVSLDQSIDPDNEVRIIDLFVDSLSLKDYGFRTDFPENGRPAYHPSDLLKLFIYGYMNKVRFSRDLEKECKRNIEVMWLLKCLKPDHNTIANFRRDNPKAIKKVFRATVQIAKHFDLIGGKLIAGDSTKLRAQNSKKNNFNQSKIDRHIAYIDNKLEDYTRTLAGNDRDNRDQIEDEINKLDERKTAYRELEDKLKESGESQISLSDPESRQIMVRDEVLRTNGNWYTTHGRRNILISFKQYKTKACKTCPARMKCTRAKAGRVIERSMYAQYYERNRTNKEKKEQLYRRRQAIAEHPFGTIKRQWGFSYILTKRGTNRASADVGFIFIAYNLRRIISILGKDQLMEYLKILISLFLLVSVFFRRIISRLEAVVYQKCNWLLVKTIIA